MEWWVGRATLVGTGPARHSIRACVAQRRTNKTLEADGTYLGQLGGNCKSGIIEEGLVRIIEMQRAIEGFPRQNVALMDGGGGNGSRRAMMLHAKPKEKNGKIQKGSATTASGRNPKPARRACRQ